MTELLVACSTLGHLAGYPDIYQPLPACYKYTGYLFYRQKHKQTAYSRPLGPAIYNRKNVNLCSDWHPYCNQRFICP